MSSSSTSTKLQGSPGSNLLMEKLSQLINLSWPIILSRVGFLGLALVDTIMVGNYATEALAALSITHAIADTFMLIAAGMLYGILVVCSMAIGKNTPEEAGEATKRGAIYALGLSVIAVVCCLAMIPVLTLFGIEESLVSAITNLMFIVVIGLPGILIYIAYSFFLEGISKPIAPMIVMLIGNVVNVFLNYALVYGHFGFPELGAKGSIISTTVIRYLLAIGMLVYVHAMMSDRNTYGINSKFQWSWSSWKMQRHIGYGGGVSFGVEAGAFMFLSMLAGLVSPIAVAASAILINIRSILFMVPMGIGFATLIHTGMGHGKKDQKDINLSTWSGTWMGTIFMIVLSIALWIFPQPLLGLYTNDSNLILASIPIIALLAIALPLDAWQNVMSNALRGREDAIMPTVILSFSYLVVMIPLAWFLTITSSRGLAGIFESMLIANLIAVVLMTIRHYILNGKVKLQETSH